MHYPFVVIICDFEVTIWAQYGIPLHLRGATMSRWTSASRSEHNERRWSISWDAKEITNIFPSRLFRIIYTTTHNTYFKSWIVGTRMSCTAVAAAVTKTISYHSQEPLWPTALVKFFHDSSLFHRLYNRDPVIVGTLLRLSHEHIQRSGNTLTLLNFWSAISATEVFQGSSEAT